MRDDGRGRGHGLTGWWVYVVGDLAGAAIAVIVITLARRLPDRAEREAAQGGALPILGSPSGSGP